MKQDITTPNSYFHSFCESRSYGTFRFLFLLFLHAICLYSFAQKQPVKFEHINADLGLSQSNVRCIFQDSRGFMWFGTRDGLNKYDGYKFTVYKYDAANSTSLSHNTIQDIAEDADGSLWVATWGGGLNRFNWKKEKFTRYIYNSQDSSGISNDRINKLLRDSEGNLWIATESGGLNLYDKKTNTFIYYRHDEVEPGSIADNRVKDIVEDSDHNLWIATASGLDFFDKKTKEFRHFRNDPADKNSLSTDNVVKLFIDSKGRLWVGTRGEGLDLFDRQQESFIHFRYNPGENNILFSNVINALYEDDDGNLWVGTENGGLSIFDPQSNKFDNYLQDDADRASLNNNSIWSIYRDAKGNMWVGTFSAGINFVNRDASKFTHYRHTSSPLSLSNNSVLSILEDADGRLWLGTDGGGLNLYDDNKKAFTHYRHNPSDTNSLSGNYVLDIFEDYEKNLWIGTWADGLTVFNRKKNTYRRFKYDPLNPKGLSSPNIWTIFEDSDKNMWLGTYSSGISRYDRANDNFIHYRSDVSDPGSLANNTINLIFEDSKKNLWIGTNGSGLELLNKKTNKFSHFLHDKNRNSISNNDVFCMAEDQEGNLWLGTHLGLNKMDRNGHFTSYFINDGLPSNTIMGILIDKNGILWISTFNGISKFNPKTKSFTNFGVNDGLQSREFKMSSCYRSRSGKMYFGGVNGFNEFIPETLREKKYDPPLVFTDFQVFNRQVPISEDKKSVLQQSITNTKELTLPYSHSVISFEFASLNYTVEDKKQYSYILEGFDADWNYVGKRHTATYTNLNPGDYVFKVRNLNNEGQWSLNIASIRLTITPPFWMTWWFRIISVLVIAGCVIVAYRYRVRSINAQRTKLQEMVNEKTRQLLQSSEEEHKARQEAEKARYEAEQANKNLERKNKELEQFAYVASHDMQEPLRTTSSYVDLLQKQYKGKLDEKADKYLSYIVHSADRMRVLIKDLLDFSRIGTKGKLEKVDCNIVLNEVLEDLAVAIQESGADIKICRMPVINGYPTELKLLFQNLIFNAIKFRKKDILPQIKIYMQKASGEWHFSVSDNGIGIDEKHSSKIFIIFQRLHSRSAYEGSGIGLAHCKKIVELHGGEIWLESEPGTGSTFHFTIPDKE
jgi:ligand-binding sensor domain-containing protein/signal transduction histidine kinase